MIFESKVLEIYRQKLLKRRDPDGRAHVFTNKEFGLKREEYTFLGDRGQTLCAYLYYTTDKDKRHIIMLDHGMGCGHNSYLKEISVLARAGFTVFTYDHTGTMTSGGEDIGGFSQSLSDLDRAVAFVCSCLGYETDQISVIGHSWGGFSTMNIPALYPEISHVVALSGFISPKEIQHQVCRGFLRLYRKMLYGLEKERLADYADYDARASLGGAKTRALIIHSRDDKTCHFNRHFEKLKKALKDKPNVRFIDTDHKGHYPQYTVEAVALKHDFNKVVKERTKNGTLATAEEKAALVASYDFHKMHEQDKDLWREIILFLKS